MIRRIKITPKFNYKHIHHTTLAKDWFEFQVHARNTGIALLHYMKTFINNNCKRAGSTGKLENAITFEDISTTAKIQWGIGNRQILNAQAKYWYVINYGKTVAGQDFVPGGGQYRPVLFQDGPADPTKTGHVASKAIAWKRITNPGTEPRPSVVRPMNYIEASQRMLVKHVHLLLVRFGKTTLKK